MIFSSSYSNLHDKFPHMIGISELKICTKIKFNLSFYSCNNEIFNGNNLSIENSFLYILRFSSNSSFSFKIEYHHENKFFLTFFQVVFLREIRPGFFQNAYTLEKCLCLFHECLGFVTGSVKCLNPYCYFFGFYNVYSWP